MLDALISIGSIYMFILIGYLTKAKFKEQIDERSLVLISIYSLQPILTFWGLNLTPIDFNLILAPAIYLIAVFSTLIIIYTLSFKLFRDRKDRAIFNVVSLVGNTGNLGIPLSLALFSESAVAYVTIINLANIFFVYTFEVYFLSRGSFSVKESLLNILKLPILWAAIAGAIFNLSNLELHRDLERALNMGAYASIVIQLLIFGAYLYSTKIKDINYRLLVSVLSVKFLLLPLIGLLILLSIEIDSRVAAIIFLELIVPLAVNNVNLASLYNCKPVDVTALVLISSILFLGLIFFDIIIIEKFF